MAGEWLHTSSIFLAAAVVTVPLAQRFGLGAVLGYLLAGIAIGPWGLQLISDVDAILHFSEFGVVLLLFLIGLELNPNKLWKMRKPIIGLGGSQVVVTSCVITAAMMFYGLAWQVSVVIGMGLALSSTAIALRVIEERKLSASESGQSGFAVLLFQDIAVIPMLAVLPVLAGGASGNWMDGLWILAGVIGIFTLGHFLLRPLFSYVVKSGARELFTVAALLLVIGVSAAMKQLGLSMALGAFLAGVLLAESEFRHELEVAIEPFKGLLLGLFFIAVGMSVNLGLLLQYPFEILAAVMILVSSKGFLLYGLARLFGTQAKARSQMAMILSQGGEFAFVLFTAAQMEGLLSRELTAFLLVVVSLSMMTTPLLLIAQDKWFARTLNSEDEMPQSDFTHATQPKVIIAGFGRFGQIVGRLLFANKIKLTILESDPSQIRLLRKFGYKVYYGDATQVELLRAAGAEKAEAIVVCKTDPQKVMEIVALCKQHFPHLKILARARSRVEAYELLNQGVDHFSRETFYGALDLGRQTLTSLGMHPYQAKRAESHFKKLDVAMLKELLPLHSDDKVLASKAKAARIELEEIFGLEMESERSNHNDWD
ncbi:glutathione-regulated potassium-efflux system protein KefB [Aliivibrio finisterrensis]|uniref:glutathione-regulated potassium-efflux system protein KefB n=1 Tax=Aliivibrio finisterrensis TaxID=511998 RepID=UPI00102161A6|nr:glutathione-regulated potassium-efflux system protein KefB [Aliivibrio finisterrensis]RYU65199.1 glutathione-regulated potassium-efflux system protein KefB [Aliivibrio finisterrensis]RYU68573.1 glutathione-regulated potassium-efflux system protein KefB [Aliivibrio finisterrensis]RYU72036.1 glutathione-regulated potassium-efflux system protein KefB [Aliivibrio finisterrensis]